MRAIESRLAKLEAKRPSDLSALSDDELHLRLRRLREQIADDPKTDKAERQRTREELAAMDAQEREAAAYWSRPDIVEYVKGHMAAGRLPSNWKPPLVGLSAWPYRRA